MSTNLLGWSIYTVFVVLALYFGWHPDLLNFSGDLALVKVLIGITYLGFLAYSSYCSMRENIFKTIAKMARLHWGRQIGIDLYLGLGLAMFVIYLNEGALVAALWLLPTLLFANLSILLYFFIHFESLISGFLL